MINEINNRKATEKNFKTKSLFFKKNNKIDKLLAKLWKKKQLKSEMKGDITTDYTEIIFVSTVTPFLPYITKVRLVCLVSNLAWLLT